MFQAPGSAHGRPAVGEKAREGAGDSGGSRQQLSPEILSTVMLDTSAGQ